MKPLIRKDLREFNEFVKGLGTTDVVKVGIFGNKTSRDEGGVTNAEVGASHEFGNPARNLPIRSFLWMPINHERKAIMKDLKDAGLFMAIAKGKLSHVLTHLGFACEAAIQRAFASDGFGRWAPLKRETIMRKLRGWSNSPNLKRRQELTKSAMSGTSGIVAILVEKGELRRSIASKVGKPE